MRAFLTLALIAAAGGAAWWLSRRQDPASPEPASPADFTASWSIPLDVYNVIETVENTVASVTLPRGLRNNNPGNLRPGSAWQGLANPADDGAGYLRFVSPHYGLRAAAINLKNQQLKHKLRTVRTIITKYAPPSENNTTAYVNAVAKRLGVSADATIDLTSRQTLERFLRAVVSHENGRGDYYDDATYATAVSAAL